MRFRYLGDKEEMTAFGYDFSNDNEPDVQDLNAIKRLVGNSHFEALDALPELVGESAVAPAVKAPAKPGRKKKVIG